MAVDEDRLGFRSAGSHDVVTVDPCLVAHPALADVIAHGRFPGATEVTLRCSGSTGERSALVDPAAAEAKASLPPDVALGGRAAIHEEIGGAHIRVSARSFFQTRADGAAALVALVRDAATAGGHHPDMLVDAYAGVGLFAATVVPTADVVCIERSAAACSDARHNLRDRSATIVQGDVDRWRPHPADVVIADPSRRGLGRKAVDVLAGTGTARLVLVSCDAVSLARDARLLASAGFHHRSSTVVDLFPHTPHVEVVSRFDRE
jgi:23S rRNA (uracil1939-C5)-methyltransferase